MPEPLSSGGRDPPHVLIVDDDADVVKAAALLLSRHGMRASGAASPLEARSALAAERADLVLLDLNFARGATSGQEGLACLRQLLEDDPEAAVVVVTGHSGIAVAVQAMQAGARDFVTKPWNNARLLVTVEDVLRTRRPPPVAERADPDAPEPTLLGESPALEGVRRRIARVAPTDAAVLLTGEAGTGKSLAARRLHLASARPDGPFVVVSLAALGAEEAAAALFGDGRGAAGALAEAAGGTLVLDEVGELGGALQGRLRAALERGGGPRLLSTSRRSRAALGGRGGLADDLLYRLSTVEIVLPPLRERGSDPLLLAAHFLRWAARRHGRPVPALSAAGAGAVMASPWPGGVRALAQAMERAVIFADGPVCEPADLGLEPAAPPLAPGAGPLDLQASERTLVAAALKRHGFNVSHAARELGLTRPALYRRMAKHGL